MHPFFKLQEERRQSSVKNVRCHAHGKKQVPVLQITLQLELKVQQLTLCDYEELRQQRTAHGSPLYPVITR